MNIKFKNIIFIYIVFSILSISILKYYYNLSNNILIAIPQLCYYLSSTFINSINIICIRQLSLTLDKLLFYIGLGFSDVVHGIGLVIVMNIILIYCTLWLFIMQIIPTITATIMQFAHTTYISILSIIYTKNILIAIPQLCHCLSSTFINSINITCIRQLPLTLNKLLINISVVTATIMQFVHTIYNSILSIQQQNDHDHIPFIIELIGLALVIKYCRPIDVSNFHSILYACGILIFLVIAVLQVVYPDKMGIYLENGIRHALVITFCISLYLCNRMVELQQKDNHHNQIQQQHQQQQQQRQQQAERKNQKPYTATKNDLGQYVLSTGFHKFCQHIIFKEKECSICCEHYRNNEVLKVLRCGHLFHPLCIQECFGKSAIISCPLCRKSCITCDGWSMIYDDH